MTPTDLATWIARAARGDSIEYHRGYLASECRDRAYRAKASGEQVEVMRQDATQLERLRSLAMSAANNGHLHLVQIKHADCDYSYIGVRAG